MRTNKDENAYIRWVSEARKAGLLIPASDQQAVAAQAAVATTACGVSLKYLRDFSVLLDAFLPQETDTATAVSKVILPCTLKVNKCRFFDVVPAEHTGPPSLYVVHAWGGSFSHMVQQLVRTLERGAHGTNSHAYKSAAFLTSTYVWLDIFAINQHPQLNSEVDVSVSLVKDMVQACTQGAIVVIDKQLQVLSRAWCLFEIWSFIYQQDVTKVDVCLPAEMSVEGMAKFEAWCPYIAHCETSKPEDKVRILSEIKGSAGAKVMQTTVRDALLNSVHTALRWSGKFADLALYCTALMQAGEHTRLQQVLYRIPELAADESEIRDIEDVFGVYCDAETRLLSLNAFEQLLQASGIPSSEAKQVFQHISMPDTGGIGFQEFQGWWLESKKQEDPTTWKPCELTMEALSKNLHRMHTLLQSRGLSSLADAVRVSIKDLESRGIKSGPLAPTSNLKGGWQTAFDEVAKKLQTQDLRGAATALRPLLMWNTDALYHSPDQLLPLDGKNMAMKELCQGLSQHLYLLSIVLWENLGLKQQSSHYRRYAEELQSDQLLKLMMKKKQEAATQAQAGNGVTKITRAEMEKRAVIRSMISLKYGGDQPASMGLVAEAEMSLAALKSSHKTSNQQATSRQNIDAVKAMSTSYMAYKGRAGEAGAGPPLLLGKPNIAKFRSHSSMMDVDTESVLLSLGPEAVAFYNSQNKTEEKAGSGRSSLEQQQQQAGAADGSTSGAVEGPGALGLPAEPPAEKSLPGSNEGKSIEGRSGRRRSVVFEEVDITTDMFLASAERHGLLRPLHPPNIPGDGPLANVPESAATNMQGFPMRTGRSTSNPISAAGAGNGDANGYVVTRGRSWGIMKTPASVSSQEAAQALLASARNSANCDSNASSNDSNVFSASPTGPILPQVHGMHGSLGEGKLASKSAPSFAKLCSRRFSIEECEVGTVSLTAGGFANGNNAARNRRFSLMEARPGPGSLVTARSTGEGGIPAVIADNRNTRRSLNIQVGGNPVRSGGALSPTPPASHSQPVPGGASLTLASPGAGETAAMLSPSPKGALGNAARRLLLPDIGR